MSKPTAKQNATYITLCILTDTEPSNEINNWNAEEYEQAITELEAILETERPDMVWCAPPLPKGWH